MSRAGWIALVIGVVGGLATAVAFFTSHPQACFSYLAAYTTVLSVVLGALLLLLIVWAMDATWPVAVRRLLEAIVATLPLFALGFTPLLLCMHHLYPWTAPARIADAEMRANVLKKIAWLNPPFFGARAGFYLAVWILGALLLRHFSLRQDQTRRALPHARPFAAAMLPLVALTMTFAAFDWLMSLLPSWSSTMFGVYWFAGGFVAAIALLTLLSARAPIKLQRGHAYALGRLLLAFTIFWSYIAFFQFFLIWIVDRPSEVPWYWVRSRGGWGALSIVIALARFAVPFFALLSYAVKQSFRALSIASIWILAAHILDGYWLVLPQLHPSAKVSWVDAAALAAVAGLTFAFGSRLARRHPLVPIGDPRLARALAYEAR